MLAEVVTRGFHLPLSSGVGLHVVEQGDAGGLPVVMLHGWPDSWQSWERVMPLLPSTWRVLAVDQRGHGLSDRPEAGYAIDDFARDAVALLDALALPQAVLVGHSMGSFVARRVAERVPERVRGLVLVGTAPVARNAVMTSIAPAVHALQDPVPPAFVREFQHSTVALPVPDAFMARAIESSQRVPARVWKAVLDGLLAFSPGDAPRCPVLVAGGTRDSLFCEAEQAAAGASLPGARVELVEGVGHALHWEMPERFAALLVGFVGGRRG